MPIISKGKMAKQYHAREALLFILFFLMIILYSQKQDTEDSFPIVETVNSNVYFCGTSVIVARTKDGIAIAADSRRVTISHNRNGLETVRYDTVCKIHKRGKWFFCASGFQADGLDSVLPSCIHANTSFLEISIELQKKIHRYRKQFLDHLKAKVPNDYEHFFRELQKLEIILCGYENNIPKVCAISFNVVSLPTEKVVLIDLVHRYLSTPTEDNCILAGHDSLIYKKLNSYKSFWNGKPFAQGADELISLEIEKYPGFVGKPLDVIIIFGEDKYVRASSSGKCDY